MLTVETRHAVSQTETKAMDTDALRDSFHFSEIFAPGRTRLLYTHYDRMIVGGVQPDKAELTLAQVKECGTALILDRREMGILNLGDTATVSVPGENFTLNRGDVLYLGRGAGPITLGQGGRFYVVSTPAHKPLSAKLIKIEEAGSIELGGPDTANERTIYQFVHPDVMESCQLVMGYTTLHHGSVWNTMPAHTHDRRMEAYLYFDVTKENRIFHFMGQPQETRHIVTQNKELVIPVL